MLLLSIVAIGSLACLLPASAEKIVRKKIIIHVPLEVHEKHHTHTVFKHVYHKNKEHKHEPIPQRFPVHKQAWVEEEKLPWKKETPKWQGWKEPQKHASSHSHGIAKNPHRISSYIPNYNHEKKREEIFEHEFGGYHKHKGSHHRGFSGDFDSDEDFNGFGRSLKGSKHLDDFQEEKKKGADLEIAKVISHTVYHD